MAFVDSEKRREYRGSGNAANLERRREYDREWNAANREKCRGYSRKWRVAHPERQYDRKLKQYGITIAEYEAKLKEQDYSCKLCETHISKLKRKLCVDHDNYNGEIRDLLCHQCNTAVG